MTALNPNLDYSSPLCTTCDFNFAGIGPLIAPYNPLKAAATITGAGMLLGSLAATPVVLVAGGTVTVPTLTIPTLTPAALGACVICGAGVLSDGIQITAEYMEITTGVEATGAAIETGLEALQGAVANEALQLGQTAVTLQSGAVVTITF